MTAVTIRNDLGDADFAGIGPERLLRQADDGIAAAAVRLNIAQQFTVAADVVLERSESPGPQHPAIAYVDAPGHAEITFDADAFVPLLAEVFS